MIWFKLDHFQNQLREKNLKQNQTYNFIRKIIYLFLSGTSRSIWKNIKLLSKMQIIFKRKNYYLMNGRTANNNYHFEKE